MTETILNENATGAAGNMDMDRVINTMQTQLDGLVKSGAAPKQESDAAPFIDMAMGGGKVGMLTKFGAIGLVAYEHSQVNRPQNNGFVFSGPGKQVGQRSRSILMGGESYGDKKEAARRNQKHATTAARSSKFVGAPVAKTPAGKPHISSISGMTMTSMGQVIPGADKLRKNIETAKENKNNSISRLAEGLSEGHESAEVAFQNASIERKQQVARVMQPN